MSLTTFAQKSFAPITPATPATPTTFASTTPATPTTPTTCAPTTPGSMTLEGTQPRSMLPSKAVSIPSIPSMSSVASPQMRQTESLGRIGSPGSSLIGTESIESTSMRHTHSQPKSLEGIGSAASTPMRHTYSQTSAKSSLISVKEIGSELEEIGSELGEYNGRLTSNRTDARRSKISNLTEIDNAIDQNAYLSETPHDQLKKCLNKVKNKMLESYAAQLNSTSPHNTREYRNHTQLMIILAATLVSQSKESELVKIEINVKKDKAHNLFCKILEACCKFDYNGNQAYIQASQDYLCDIFDIFYKTCSDRSDGDSEFESDEDRREWILKNILQGLKDKYPKPVEQNEFQCIHETVLKHYKDGITEMFPTHNKLEQLDHQTAKVLPKHKKSFVQKMLCCFSSSETKD